ncbi:PREDICTED: uncharacterized protein At1g04910 isoform X2 [Tarenaya hassleriana]|uniref:uncharacterized protein At1g04910 isoform X2 n=1 Tax=Tarenaya hassleriana TaxID=28532 RepID=UPI00053C5D3E|nr:PREDICTED: uncharacterized protein At1g04910 isoform X2 [Tarenaya hassleriana]
MASSKWKKREHEGETDKTKLIIAGIRHQLLLLRRRRHGVFQLVSGCLLLLLLVSFSLLSPPPPFTRHHYVRNNEVALERNPKPPSKFHIPANGESSDRELWNSSFSRFYYGCSNADDGFQVADQKTHRDRYLLIATSGGLNQQRTGIIDAVVAAYILNATLVVPKLDQKSYWKDSSNFEEIFDVDWFISYLSKDVKIIEKLPQEQGKTPRHHTVRVPRKCTPSCYLHRVLPLLTKKHAVELSKFDYRLSNKLDASLQRLRCRVNYHALRYTPSIDKMGRLLVERMRKQAQHFVALHLRFEPDMLAFSGCYYGGGDRERAELGAIRTRWKTLHTANPDKVRRHGRCPLTPEEIGLMLRALGFGSDVHLYVASGEVYGGEKTIAPLRALFPNLHTKETLTSKEELAPFAQFSSRMAALDFMVCDESDAFVTNNNGNMARILAGRRRYFGHKVTIRPNAKKLHKLFTNRDNMTWDEFASKLRSYQQGFMGEPEEIKPGHGEFHENPSSCICRISEAAHMEHTRDKETGYLTEDEPDLSDSEYSEMANVPATDAGSSSSSLKPDQAEVDEVFSD